MTVLGFGYGIHIYGLAWPVHRLKRKHCKERNKTSASNFFQLITVITKFLQVTYLYCSLFVNYLYLLLLDLLFSFFAGVPLLQRISSERLVASVWITISSFRILPAFSFVFDALRAVFCHAWCTCSQWVKEWNDRCAIPDKYQIYFSDCQNM